MNHMNLEYLESLYNQFKTVPESVGTEWKRFFEGVDFAKDGAFGLSEKELDVYHLITAYRNYGHFEANLDPLTNSVAPSDQLRLNKFNLKESDLNTKFQIGSIIGKPNATLAEILNHLKSVYCGTLTVQCAEALPDIRNWFIKEFEQNPTNFKLTADEKKEILSSITNAEALEKFIHTRYVGTKRFSVEGGDAVLPMLDRFTSQGASLKVEEVVLGMAHRGRINVLANYMGKNVGQMFADFNGPTELETPLEDYDGDVKYHLGYSSDRQTVNGPCHISLAFNPSHLEIVDPVVMGMARAKQRRRLDTKERKKVLPILIHGDAAFIGQGVVAETLQLSRLPGYTVGGTIHVIVDNQVGFTTDPKDSRSVRYSADAAKSIKAPVLLVNGDDAEGCVRAMDIALRFRHEFGEDVVIDQVCYRRYGHNEGDEPSFTQPVMYEAIKNHPTLMNIYLDQISQTAGYSRAEGEAFYKEKVDNLQKILDRTRKERPAIKANAFNGTWSGLRKGTLADFDKTWETKSSRATLDKVANVLSTEPKEIQVHPKIAKLIQSRKAMTEGKGHFDWAMGELFAYGSLCLEGTPVRVSGQDCKRGTFTHRQAVYFDVNNNQEFCPLATLNPDKAEFVIYNSSLSEMAVMGFEYGNSFSDPTFMTIWEAQFGDFANGAQIVIDQFLSAGEEKWARGSGLTLLLPHGYEGQGPEHSSARLERFLQLCAQANMQVCNLTTPANLFHVLRRQMKRDFRKPLVIMSPKSLLRHPKVISEWKDFTDGAFQEVIADPKNMDLKNIETLVLCSGKLYYDLDAAREDKYKDSSNIGILRVEQLYPFPRVQLTPFINGAPKLSRVIWVQEEPKNMGAYQYIFPRIDQLLEELGKKKIRVEYVGRTERASPAVGSPYLHQKEQTAIIDMVFKG